VRVRVRVRVRGVLGRGRDKPRNAGTFVTAVA
jgi:hypothetical protein